MMATKAWIMEGIAPFLWAMGLAGGLFYGTSAYFALTGDAALDTPTTWIGLAVSVLCSATGIPLLWRQIRSDKR